jgi:hypothetical protein
VTTRLADVGVVGEVAAVVGDLVDLLELATTAAAVDG